MKKDISRCVANLSGSVKQQTVLVVFSDNTDIKWLNFLKPGFRHCYALIWSGTHWIQYNPLSHRTEVTLYFSGEVEDLCNYLRLLGYRVIRIHRFALKRKPAPLGLFTCVEAVKRVLGIHKTGLLTPWSLYRFLCGEARITNTVARSTGSAMGKHFKRERPDFER